MRRGDLLRVALRLVVSVTFLAVSGCGDNSKDDPCLSLKIAGGNECEVQPLSVALVTFGTGYCSGTFITKRDVLTAAHCVPQGSGEILVITKSFSEKTLTFVRHPDYIPGTLSDNDVAVVTISRDAPVVPVPLLQSQLAQNGDSVVAYGYGLDQNRNDVVSRVEQGGMPLKATYLKVYSVDSSFIRTISDGGGDTCSGDSGGPILARGTDNDYGIISVVSFGPSLCRSDTGFASSSTNVQTTSVSEFILHHASSARIN